MATIFYNSPRLYVTPVTELKVLHGPLSGIVIFESGFFANLRAASSTYPRSASRHVATDRPRRSSVEFDVQSCLVRVLAGAAAEIEAVAILRAARAVAPLSTKKTPGGPCFPPGSSSLDAGLLYEQIVLSNRRNAAKRFDRQTFRATRHA
jgi:hypothetical protein